MDEDRRQALTELADEHAAAELERLTDEQAALLRLATVIAEGAPPAAIFTAAGDEIDRLIGSRTVISRYSDDGTSLVSVGVSARTEVPVGKRWKLEDGMASAEVYRTGHSARVEKVDWSSRNGPTAETARRIGVHCATSTPVFVGDRLWGTITVLSAERLPAETEERLERFSRLVATAIANADSREAVAQAHEALAQVADEQTALRRVATLVAQDAPPAAIFAAVSVEVDRLFCLGAHTQDVAGVVRFDPGPEHLVVGVSRTLEAVKLGSRWEPLDLFAPTRVLHTGRAARVDENDLESIGGPVADFLRQAGYLSQAASPIVVGGRLWGAISVNSGQTLARDTEERLEKFTELVAAAIANAESHEALAELADEQAALRRVATLVAEGTAPTDLFAAVAVEVAAVVGVSSGSVSRFLPDGSSVVLASHNDPGFPVGSQWRPDEGTINAAIVEAARPARVDQKVLSGPIAEASRISDVRSAVAAPIVVEGTVWGMIAVGRQHSDEPLPPQTETRLAAFTELIATAIANAEARDGARRLADEQSALRRVAILVAGGAPDAELFAAVAREVSDVTELPMIGIDRYEQDGSLVVLASPNIPIGSRFPIPPDTVGGKVFETRAPVRIDSFQKASSDLGVLVRDAGMQSAVGAPIFVDGSLWGVLIAGTDREQPLPVGTEFRLVRFAELIGTSIANAAARDGLTRLAHEQAALRRVATLCARDAPSTEVFGAVATEVGTLFSTDITVVGRYDNDGVATAIGNWSASGGGVPVGTRSAIGGHNVLSLVAETGRPARIDGYDEASGEAADIARRYGWRSSIAAPIIVEDRVWGVMLVATQRPEAFPPGAEERLAAFTDLVATAVANTKARAEVEQLADEQAALRRVATLVAKEDLPAQVFAKVAEETARLLGGVECTLLRNDPDGGATNVGCWGETIAGVFPVGTHFFPEPAGDGVAAIVLRTGRSYRIDDYSTVADPIARSALDRGIGSAVGCPIVVRGAVWGAIFVTGAERFPPETELRLMQFADLVATAVANAGARAEIVRLAEEQAAQRRVATLVARGAQPREIFSAVTDEVSRLFDTELAIVGRFEEDPPAVVAVAVGKAVEGIDVGSSWRLDDPEASNETFRSRRAVRATERLRQRSAALADTMDRLGVTSTVASPIIVDGRLWGSVIVPSLQELPADTEERLEKFTDLVGIAIANADGKSELAASRRRIVAASDAERRRIERNLHDGTQQRLVSLGLAVRAAEANLPPDRPDLRDELSRVAMGLADAVEDLQEISRGIHPAILSKGGLGAAVRTLATLSPIAVDLDVKTERRLAEPVEVAAYFVVSEALANAAKYSQATRIDVSLHRRDDRLRVSIRDDGLGGADPGRGSGLIGLTDRVEALGGSLTVHSRPGEGTQIRAELPVET